MLSCISCHPVLSVYPVILYSLCILSRFFLCNLSTCSLCILLLLLSVYPVTLCSLCILSPCFFLCIFYHPVISVYPISLCYLGILSPYALCVSWHPMFSVYILSPCALRVSCHPVLSVSIFSPFPLCVSQDLRHWHAGMFRRGLHDGVLWNWESRCHPGFRQAQVLLNTPFISVTG